MFIILRNADLRFQTLYPNVQLDDVNAAFRYGLELTKAAVLDELKAGGYEMPPDGVEAWTPPDIFVHLMELKHMLAKARVDTAYEQYCDWHAKLAKKPYSGLHRKTCKD